jgi:hypothetical protein
MKILSSVACVLSAWALSLPASAQQYDAKPASVTVPVPPRAITIDDYFQIRDVAQPELSPEAAKSTGTFPSSIPSSSIKP